MARPPGQLPLFPTRRAGPAADEAKAPREARKASRPGIQAAERTGAEPAQLPLALRPARRVAVIAGGGSGTGHRRARLVALDGGAAARAARPLPNREEITAALLQGLADLVAGRISVAAAAAIREAAEQALRQLDAAELDPHARPGFVRAARALQELIG